MQSNRIQHFLFTNNLPSGLSYRTSILSSTVYYEGAEYPFLPELPMYVGKFLDFYPNNAGLIDSDCQKQFQNSFLNYEVSLSSIEQNNILAVEQSISQFFDCLNVWCTDVGFITGVEFFYEFLAILDSFTVTLMRKFVPPEVLGELFTITERIARFKITLKSQWGDVISKNNALEKEIEHLRALVAEYTRRLKEVQGNTEATIQFQRLIQFWRSEISKLRALIKPVPPFAAMILNELADIFTACKYAVINAAKWAASTGGSRIVATFKNLMAVVGAFKDTLLGVLALLFKAVSKIFTYVSAFLIGTYTKTLVDCLSKTCSDLVDKLKENDDKRQIAASKYYEDLTNVLNGGCCKTYCCYTIGSKGEEVEVDISACGSGSSGSNIQGFGLTLLMGNKYIPSYVDYKTLTSNMSPDVIIGKTYKKPCGWDLQCGVPSPDCTKMGNINPNTTPPSQYPINSWDLCDSPDVTIAVEGTPPREFKVKDRKCACGWETYFAPTCTFEGMYDALLTYWSTIPNAGKWPNSIATGMTIGL